MDRSNGHDDGMEDDRTTEAVEHLQTAARELLLAARSFLDVVEEVVEDRDRLAGAASSVVTLLRDGVTSAMPPGATLQPWEQAAWGAGTPDDTDASDPDLTEDEDVDPERDASAVEVAPAKTAPAKKAPAKKAPAKKAPAKRSSAKKAPAKAASATTVPAEQGETAAAPPRRVRRIAVD